MSKPQQPQIPADVKKHVQALVTSEVEKAVGSRMATTPPPAPAATPGVVAVERKLTTAQKLGIILQKHYAEKVQDPALSAGHRKILIERAANILAGTTGQGGSLIPPQYANEVITAVYERAVLAKAGAIPVPYSGSSLTFGKVNQGVSVEWTSEAGEPTLNNVGTGDLKLLTKYLKGAVKISNTALRAPGPDQAAIFADDVLRAFAAAADAAFLTGDGTGNNPQGIQSQADAGQVIAASATPTFRIVRKDLTAAMKRVRVSKLDFDGVSPAWLMDAATYFALISMHTGYAPVFPSLESHGTLFGYPVFVTEALAASGGRVLFGLMKHVLMGANEGPEVQIGLAGNDLIAGTTTIAGQFSGDAKLRYTKALAGVTGTAAWDAVTA